MFKIDEDDIPILLISAFRYALGRRSYVTSSTAAIILANKNYLTDYHRRLMAKEVHEHKEIWGNIGDECDEKMWLDFANKIIE